MYKCKFLYYEKHLSRHKLAHVEFILNSSGIKFEYNFDPKKFILIKSDFKENRKNKKRRKH